MRTRNGLVAFAIIFAACGNMGGGNNGGGASGGTGGGASGGSGGGGTGGTGGGGSGGTGGSGGSSVPPDYASGSRIKARVISTGDGAKAFAGYYDSSLSVICGFNRAVDDTLRCLPTTYTYVGSYYSDSGCSTALAYSSMPGCTPTYALKTETTASCLDIGFYPSNSRQRVYSVGSAYGSAMVWSGTPGNCSSSSTPTAFAFYTIGAEVPASTFAAGSVDIAP
jgi:hypothetical protein